MQYEDRITIPTPEGVHLELALAGVGSRFASAIVDFVIQAALLIAVFVGGIVVFGSGGFTVAAITVTSFFVLAAYDILFEVFASGRTPGKGLNGLRVVRTDGSPVGFFTSAVRPPAGRSRRRRSKPPAPSRPRGTSARSRPPSSPRCAGSSHAGTS